MKENLLPRNDYLLYLQLIPHALSVLVVAGPIVPLLLLLLDQTTKARFRVLALLSYVAFVGI
jgi:hypothetical protein